MFDRERRCCAIEEKQPEMLGGFSILPCQTMHLGNTPCFLQIIHTLHVSMLFAETRLYMSSMGHLGNYVCHLRGVRERIYPASC